MSLFSKKTSIVLKSEKQKDAYIEKLDHAHIAYDVFVERENIYSRDVSYIVRVNSTDLKKVS